MTHGNDRQSGGGDGGAAPGGGAAPSKAPSLLERFRSGRGEWLRTWWPWLVVAAVLTAVGWFLVKPAPPDTVVIATGRSDGAYHAFAGRYAEAFHDSGVTLDVRESAGSVENYRLLADGGSGFSVAIVQGGSVPPDLSKELRSIASLYLEPVWVFYRGGEAIGDFGGLRGKRLAVGPEGSGTRAIAQRLLAANGVATGDAAATAAAASATTAPAADAVTFHPHAGGEAADALRAGEVDAALFVLPPTNPLVRDLLADEQPHGIRLLSLDRHEAYARVFPFVSDVKLPRGVVDLARNLPPRDVHLVAPAANLVARADLHPAIVALLIRSATLVHERGDLLGAAQRFPNTQYVELPMDSAAREYFRSGPPLLQRYLPFWLAALVDRMKILLLPLITLVIPLARWAPPLYDWRIRSRIYRWYQVLRDVDQRLRDTPDGFGGRRLDAELETIATMERELGEVKVPLSYMEEFYNLRLHTQFVRRRLEERLREAAGAAS